MKVDRLETHDRLKHFKEDQKDIIQQGCEDCLKKNPLSLALQDRSPYIYIYAHPRTHEDGVTKIMMWQPRLSRPRMEPNSYLFRAVSKTDIVEICWMLPPQEMWGQYKKGNVTEHQIVSWSIAQYLNNREEMEAPHKDDWDDILGMRILEDVKASLRQQKLVMESVSLLLKKEAEENKKSFFKI